MDKTHMINFIDAEKAFHKHTFMVNGPENKLEGTNLNQIKAMYEKPTADVFINRESSKQGSHEGERAVCCHDSFQYRAQSTSWNNKATE